MKFAWIAGPERVNEDAQLCNSRTAVHLPGVLIVSSDWLLLARQRKTQTTAAKMINLAFFVPACLALNLAFGPSNLLALTHGAQAGPVFAIRAGVGRLVAFAPMIAVSAMGLGLILAASETVFSALKIAGAVYLAWLGIRLLRSASASQVLETGSSSLTPAQAFRREVLVALGNPKAILIFAAFFPQFIVAEQYWQSYLLVGGLFLVLELIAIAVYAMAGSVMARAAHKRLHWFQRGSGAGMLVFAVLLLLTRRPAEAG